MKRAMLLFVFCLVIILALVSSGNAENKVWVESKTVSRDQNYAKIHLFIQNDIPIAGVVVPLIMESTSGGAFVKSIELSFDDRLTNYLTDYSVRNQYDIPDGICGIICDTIPDSVCDTSRGFHSISAVSGRHDVPSSPHGVYFVKARFTSALLPVGVDSIGSLVISANIGSTDGTFSIDSTCTDPRNHLIFIDADAHSISPSFQAGVITVSGECCGKYTGGYTGNTNCDPNGMRNLTDVTRLIDRIYLSRLPLCCEANGNVNGDDEGFLNLTDVTRLIDNIYLSKAQTAACK